jgi:hypothetical protein
MTEFAVRLPNRLRPIAEQIAREEYRTLANVIQMLIEKGLTARALEAGRNQQKGPTT